MRLKIRVTILAGIAYAPGARQGDGMTRFSIRWEALAYGHSQLFAESSCYPFQGFQGGVGLFWAFQPLIRLVREAKLFGDFRLALAAAQGPQLQGDGDMISYGYRIAAGKLRHWNIFALNKVKGKDAVKGVFGHMQRLLLGKAAGHDIGHVWKLRDELLTFFFDDAVIDHIISPLFPPG